MAQMLEDSSSSSSNGSGSLAWVPYAQNCSYFQEDNRRNQLANPARGIASILLNIVRRGDEILGNEALMQVRGGGGRRARKQQHASHVSNAQAVPDACCCRRCAASTPTSWSTTS